MLTFHIVERHVPIVARRPKCTIIIPRVRLLHIQIRLTARLAFERRHRHYIVLSSTRRAFYEDQLRLLLYTLCPSYPKSCAYKQTSWDVSRARERGIVSLTGVKLNSLYICVTLAIPTEATHTSERRPDLSETLYDDLFDVF